MIGHHHDQDRGVVQKTLLPCEPEEEKKGGANASTDSTLSPRVFGKRKEKEVSESGRACIIYAPDSSSWKNEESVYVCIYSLSLSFSPASNFNYTATRRARFDARPAYQDNGFHRRPMVRIYPIRGKGLRLISIASRYPSPADRFVRIFRLSLSLSSRTASTGYSVHEATTRHDDTIRYDTVFFFSFSREEISLRNLFRSTRKKFDCLVTDA